MMACFDRWSYVLIPSVAYAASNQAFTWPIRSVIGFEAQYNLLTFALITGSCLFGYHGIDSDDTVCRAMGSSVKAGQNEGWGKLV